MFFCINTYVPEDKDITHIEQLKNLENTAYSRFDRWASDGMASAAASVKERTSFVTLSAVVEPCPCPKDGRECGPTRACSTATLLELAMLSSDADGDGSPRLRFRNVRIVSERRKEVWGLLRCGTSFTRIQWYAVNHDGEPRGGRQ